MGLRTEKGNQSNYLLAVIGILSSAIIVVCIEMLFQSIKIWWSCQSWLLVLEPWLFALHPQLPKLG